MKVKTHTIWDNYNIDIDDYDDEFFEWYGEPDEMTDDEKWEHCVDYVWNCLDDEKVNLDIPLRAEVLAIASLGLWDGRRTGYRVLGRNVNEIFKVMEDYNIYTCDRYNVRGRCIHHDGTNYILYRAFREELSEAQKENFLEALYDGRANERMVRRYTTSLAPYVREVYGW